MQNLQIDRTRVNNVRKIRVYLQEKEGEEDNSWVLNILQDLVTAVLDDGKHLKSFDIAGSGLSSVDWGSLSQVLLAQVLVILEKGSFSVERPNDGQTYNLIVRPGKTDTWSISNLSPDYVRSFFKMIAESSVMNMKSLWLGYYGGNIPHIQPDLVSQAVTKLEKFWATRGLLTAGQISAVFSRLSVVREHKMRTLILRSNNLSSVPTDILVAAISSLEEVRLWNTELTTQQISAIFTELSVLKDHKLRTLDLRDNKLRSVPTEILVAGISGLEVVELERTSLTKQQLTGIFTGLSVQGCDLKLKTLDLEWSSLKSVPTDILVAGISGLEVVNLMGTSLTREQLTGIYMMVADRRCSRLRRIKLGGNNDRSSVSQDLWERAQLNQSVRII